MIWVAITVGVLIILGLSVYAGILFSRLYKQNQQVAAGQAKRLNYLHESIATISLAMQQGQCELSEGCIRLVVLLDNLPNAEKAGFAQRFPKIHEMYERIKHMPTHDARKQLSKKELHKLDREREQLEVDLGEGIQADVVQVIALIKAERK
ncbi:DUF2489 domain-containing protein [Aliidiomarina quisquiliarum]|uniref:DUF2489 domain-containing protein n=1 Tax=Aliidiomarina quisquiliarum TaxID=2938947 RepID=UPI00208E66A9|nr:DUF2489 domain-containing protein [Aliidiomarina quisquiliarum]MCO4321316.1 DUF2489 domain-containing protein [Aliidiomarina quisquiliarum]